MLAWSLTRSRKLAYALPVLLACAPAPAHEEILAQVASLTRRIAAAPGNATLHLRRGELHRVHRDWTEALVDYHRAMELDPGLPAVNLCLAELLLGVERPCLALAALDRFLASCPDHARAVILRGRALLGMGLRLAAARDLTLGIELQRGARSPRPEEYLDRARALAAEGGEHIDEAIRGLDEGARRLGGAITLQLLAIDLEVSRGRWDAALERLASIEERSPRKEGWLARRGDVLLEAGRRDEAQRAFRAALDAIAALPQHCRSTPATVALAERIHTALSSPGLVSGPAATSSSDDIPRR